METERHLEISKWIKARASELGFAACGISGAAFLESEKERLNNWLLKGYHGEMSYMARDSEKRLDTGLLLPGARSVISVLMNYFPAKNPSAENNYKIAKYAYGKDYHVVIQEKLNVLIKEIKDRAGECQARAFTDSGPVMDKAWAERAGLGWRGKNSLIIHPKIGSFVFIGEIITDLELEIDQIAVDDLCGDCTECIKACPTGAIVAPRVLDAGKCISYYTLEHHGELPEGLSENFNNWIYGCDICQDVCPWNRKAKACSEEAFRPHPTLMEMNKAKWEQLSQEQFNDLFRNSSVQRRKFSGLTRNILFLKNGHSAF